MKRFVVVMTVWAMGLTGVLASVVFPSSASAAAPTRAGSYASLAPARLLDTRIGVGAAKAAVAPFGTVSVQVTGRGGVPATGVSAVVLNVTVVAPAKAGFITAFGAGAARPLASNLNFLPGQTVPNLVVAPVGVGGKVNLYNGSGGGTYLVADVAGYYKGGTPVDAGAFGSLTPSRLLDTRAGVGATKAAVAPTGTVDLQVTGRGGVPAGVSAVVLNVTSTGSTKAGFISLYASGTPRPPSSNLNFLVGQTVPNLVIAPVNGAGKVTLYNGSPTGTTALIADVAGYYTGGAAVTAGAYGSLVPGRLLDTRDGTGAAQAVPVAPYGAVDLRVTGSGGVPAGASAVVLNLTATRSTKEGFITVYGAGTTRPLASNLNFVASQSVQNLVIAPVGANGTVSLYNGSTGSTDLIADVFGYFLANDLPVTSSWRVRLGAAVTGAQANQTAPVALKSRVVSALRPETGGALSPATVEAVAADVTNRYVDDTRPHDAAAAQEVYQHDNALAAALESRLNSDEAVEPLLGAAIDLLTATRATGTSLVADLEALTGYAPGTGALLDQGKRFLAQGDEAWSKGQPVSAVAHYAQAADSAYRGLGDHGLSYTEDADVDGDAVPDLLELIFGANPFSGDTDSDGLTDAFEIKLATGAHLPDARDTDGDGVQDGAEDVDGDSLNALAEQSAGSSPLRADTDGDGLRDDAEVRVHRTNPTLTDTDGDGADDGAELRAGTNPLVADTDGDGKPDGGDVATATVTDPSGVVVKLTGTGDLAGGVKVRPVQDASLRKAPGIVTDPVEVHLDATVADGVNDARLSLPIDFSTLTSDSADLRVFTYDPKIEQWVPAGTDPQVDLAAGTVSTTVTHFSIFAIFNVRNWKAALTGLGGSCLPTGTGQPVDVDVAFVLDSSGSMGWNDPNGLRQTSAKQFVDALLVHDRGAVIDFDGSAAVVQYLTGDKAALRAAIDGIDSSGGTDIGVGVNAGLTALAANTDPARVQMMILLTDGEGPYDASYTQAAALAGITIYVVGLGSAVDQSLLTGIAAGTGGHYYAVASAGDLPQVFRTIQNDAGDNGLDTDGDGLTDCREEQGVTDGSGLTFTSDPRVADTDGDGMLDGEEVFKTQPSAEFPGLTAWTLFSDPRQQDSDADGLTDPQEVNAGTRARGMDSDGDTVGDFEEIDVYGTDPRSNNTDLDERDDGWEIQNAAAGFDPQVPDVEMSKWDYAGDFILGGACPQGWGWCEKDTLAWLAGTISGGFFAYKDVLDIIGGVTSLDFVGAGLSAAALVPVVGDGLSVVTKGLKFIKRAPGRVGDAMKLILERIPPSARSFLLRQYDVNVFDELIGHGFSPDTLAKYATKRLDIKVLHKFVTNAAEVRPGAPLYKTEKEAEEFLRNVAAGDLPRQKGFRPPGWVKGQGTRGYRYPDIFNPITGLATEVKRGYLGLSPFVATEIQKDVALLAQGGDIARVEWHFFPDTNGIVGGSEELLNRLIEKGIPYIVHVP
jgi:von Willebrand factor type A domain/Bacterial TSP3 repeat